MCHQQVYGTEINMGMNHGQNIINYSHKNVCHTARRQETSEPENILGANLLFSNYNT